MAAGSTTTISIPRPEQVPAPHQRGPVQVQLHLVWRSGLFEAVSHLWALMAEQNLRSHWHLRGTGGSTNGRSKFLRRALRDPWTMRHPGPGIRCTRTSFTRRAWTISPPITHYERLQKYADLLVGEQQHSIHSSAGLPGPWVALPAQFGCPEGAGDGQNVSPADNGSAKINVRSGPSRITIFAGVFPGQSQAESAGCYLQL